MSSRLSQRAAAPSRDAAERLFVALKNRTGLAHARRVLTAACGATSVAALPSSKWTRAAAALRAELQAVALAARALALVKTKLHDETDAAMTRRARALIRNNLDVIAEDAIADALAKHTERAVADALQSKDRDEREDERRERAKNYRACAAGLHVVDADVRLPWLLVHRTDDLWDESNGGGRASITIDEAAPALAVAFEIGGKIGFAVFAAEAGIRFKIDGQEFDVPRDVLRDAFSVARNRTDWFSWDWRDGDDPNRISDGKGCIVTR